MRIMSNKIQLRRIFGIISIASLLVMIVYLWISLASYSCVFESPCGPNHTGQCPLMVPGRKVCSPDLAYVYDIAGALMSVFVISGIGWILVPFWSKLKFKAISVIAIVIFGILLGYCAI